MVIDWILRLYNFKRSVSLELKGMKIAFRTVAVALCFALTRTLAQAQEARPIQWSFSSIPISESEAKLVFTANLDKGWHLYSQFIEEGGPIPTRFTFFPDGTFFLKGKVKEEGIPIRKYDSVFSMPIVWYNTKVIFSQQLTLNAPLTTVKGKVEFMMCNDQMCLPPYELTFVVGVNEKDKSSKGK